MNPFLEACGAEGLLQLDLKDQSGSTIGRWTLDKPYALIGRDPGADVVLNHDDVSRRHAYVQVIGGRAFFVDLGSRTGVACDDEPQRAGWLRPDQKLGIGPFRIQLRGGVKRSETGPDGGNELDPLSERSSKADHLPGVILQFRDRSAWRIRRLLTLVGSAKACKLRLEGPGLSAYHCSLVRTSQGMWAVDLGGRNGITVNTAQVDAARLGDGDVLEVGGFQFKFQSDPPPSSDRPGLPAVMIPDRALPERRPMLPTTKTLPEWAPALPADGRELTPQVMLGQFALMQQQVLDVVQQQMSAQFHQVIQVMAHMIDTLHRDQSDLIRREFERVRELTDEIQALSARAGAAGPSPATRPAPESPLPLPLPAPSGEASDDVHAFIQSRMGELQRERQSRWQRLVELLMGRTGEVAAP